MSTQNTTPPADLEQMNKDRDWLRRLLPPGSTVYGITRHTARSGDSHVVDFYAIRRNEPIWITGTMAEAYPETFTRSSSRHTGIKVHGLGMDMVLQTARTLATCLHDNSDALRGEHL